MVAGTRRMLDRMAAFSSARGEPVFPKGVLHMDPVTPPLLYADFDGVLHPAEVVFGSQGPMLADTQVGHRLFEHAAVLATLLDAYPEVRVVLSTSWVIHLGFEHAVSRLPPSLREKVIGATFDPRRHSAGFLRVARGYQVVQDAKQRGARVWFALDDDGDDWPARHRRQLIRTDRIKGLGDETAISQLRAALDGTRAS